MLGEATPPTRASKGLPPCPRRARAIGMSDRRRSGGGGGAGAGGGSPWNFLTKTIPSVSGFVSSVANKWLSEQDMLEEEQRNAELETEIQGQISKISELLREQDRPLARDGTRNLDMEIQHQLTRIQELLVETKRRGGGRFSDADSKAQRAGGGASVQSEDTFQRVGDSSQRPHGSHCNAHYHNISVDTAASPVRTPAGSDAGWSTADSTPGYNHSAGGPWASTPQPNFPVQGGAGVGSALSHSGYPETPAASRSARQPGRAGDFDDAHFAPRQLEGCFDSTAAAGAQGAGGAGGDGSRNPARGGEGDRDARKISRKKSSRPPPQAVDQDELRTLFSRARHGRYKDVEAMLETGISADVRDEYGNTLLTIAAQNGNKRIAKICLRRGCNINAQNFRGQVLSHTRKHARIHARTHTFCPSLPSLRLQHQRPEFPRAEFGRRACTHTHTNAHIH